MKIKSKVLTEVQLFNRIHALAKGQDPVLVIRASMAQAGISLRDANDPNLKFAALQALREITDKLMSGTVVPTPSATANATRLVITSSPEEGISK